MNSHGNRVKHEFCIIPSFGGPISILQYSFRKKQTKQLQTCFIQVAVIRYTLLHPHKLYKLERKDGEPSERKAEAKVHQGGKPLEDGIEKKAFENGKETEEGERWSRGNFHWTI